jgi:hypothetical protein
MKFWTLVHLMLTLGPVFVVSGVQAADRNMNAKTPTTISHSSARTYSLPKSYAQPQASQGHGPSLSVQKTTSVNLPIASFTRSCEVTKPNKCSYSASVSAFGAKASASTNGDICLGAGSGAGIGGYVKGSAVACGNFKDGSTAMKANGEMGYGAKVDGLEAGLSVGRTVTYRDYPSPKVTLPYQTRGTMMNYRK